MPRRLVRRECPGNTLGAEEHRPGDPADDGISQRGVLTTRGCRNSGLEESLSLFCRVNPGHAPYPCRRGSHPAIGEAPRPMPPAPITVSIRYGCNCNPCSIYGMPFLQQIRSPFRGAPLKGADCHEILLQATIRARDEALRRPGTPQF
jgi:hypothetical protein